jgi:hypothetical protein
MKNHKLFYTYVIFFVVNYGCSKEISYDTISDSLANRSWTVEESYLRYETGDTVSYRVSTFDITINEDLMGYVDYRRDSVFIQPTADQEYVLWMFKFFPGTFDVHVCDVITESSDFHYWVRNDIEFMNDQPYSGIRSEFKLTAK